MENKTQRKPKQNKTAKNRTMYNDIAKEYFKDLTAEQRQTYIKGWNIATGQNQMSLPRIAIKLMMEDNIPIQQVKPLIQQLFKKKVEELKAVRAEKKRVDDLQKLQEEQARIKLIVKEKIQNQLINKVKDTRFKNLLAEQIGKRDTRLEAKNKIYALSKSRKERRKEIRNERIKKAENKIKHKKIQKQSSSYYLKLPNNLPTNKVIGNQIYMSGLDLPFLYSNLDTIKNTILDMLRKLPAGFKYNISFVGDQYKADAFVKSARFLTTYIEDNFNIHMNQIDNSRQLDMPSEYYWNITKIEINYELNQGGSIKDFKLVKDLSFLDGYKVYSPKTLTNCGRAVLDLYGIIGERGFLPLAYMRSKLEDKKINVYLYEEGFAGVDDEFVLLINNHYVKCVKTAVVKKEQKIKRKENRVTNLVENKLPIFNSVLVWDIEAKNVDGNQVPFMIGSCEDENSFDYVYGDSCVEEFVIRVLTGKNRFIVGFNSGKYDFLLIRNELIKQGCGIQEIRRGGNDILKAIITYKDETFYFIDLLNFTIGSLKKNLENYKCLCSKGEIDYSKIGYDLSSEFMENLVEYLRLDVVGTYQLYLKIDEPFKLKGKTILDPKVFTLSQVAFSIVMEYWKIEGYVIPKINKNLDQFCRRASYGGRCEVFKREFKCKNYNEIMKNIKQSGATNYDDIYDYMDALDVNSLYPYVMRNFNYPVGVPLVTATYKHGFMGIYECDVVKPKNILYPVCSDKKNNSYNLYDLTNECYTSIDIEQMRDYGYEVKIKYGYYWEDTAPLFKSYIDEYYELKKSSPKDSVIYQNAKLMLNAPFGKTLQNDDKETYYICSTEEDLVAMYKGKKQKDFKMYYELVGEDVVGYYTYIQKKEELDLTDKKAFVGAFILSYSKRVMYDLLTKSNPYYTDTDSLYIDHKYSNLFNIGGELGQFSGDVDGKIIYACFVAKKLKYVEYINSKGEFKVSVTGKGCYKKNLNKSHFKKMLKTLVVDNYNPNLFVRDLKNGKVKVVENTKNVSMNDANRIWTEKESVPFGYGEETTYMNWGKPLMKQSFGRPLKREEEEKICVCGKICERFYYKCCNNCFYG